MSQLSFEEFLNRMKKADENLINELERVLTISSLRMEKSAKLNATSFPRVRTGRLRSSITGLVDAPNGVPRIVMRAGGTTSGQDVYYAKYVEFGTNRIKPRLFMGRSVKRERELLPDRLNDLLSIALEVD